MWYNREEMLNIIECLLKDCKAEKNNMVVIYMAFTGY